MIICQNCGHENPDDPSFCTQCGAFLPWDESTRADTGTGGEPAAAVGMTLISEDLHVAAGGEVEAELQVRNNGRVVDHVTTQVLGPPAAWAEVDPGTLQLMPNHEGTVRIRFRPPRSPGVPAGRIPFGVQATSRADPSVIARVDTSLDLEPFRAIQPELVPRTSEGRRVGEHRLTVANAGNEPFRARIEVDDPDQKLRAAVRPRILDLPAGQTAVAELRIRPRRLRLLGQPITHPFQVVLDPRDAAPTMVDGAMLQQPLLPRWAIPVAAGLVTLLIAMVAVAAIRPRGDSSPSTTAAPVTTTTTTTTTLPTTTSPLVVPPATPPPATPPPTPPATPPPTPPPTQTTAPPPTTQATSSSSSGSSSSSSSSSTTNSSDSSSSMGASESSASSTSTG